MLQNIPTHVIAGPLGAGKTSLIKHLLSQKPATERWAILINEFGQIGLDAALLSTAEDGIALGEVAGGCLCCVNGAPFQIGLGRLLRKAQPDRLFIEPSGLGHPALLLEQLRVAPWNGVLAVQPGVIVLDAQKLSRGEALPQAQREAALDAGLMLLNKSGTLDAAQRQAILATLPDGRVLWTEAGVMQLDCLPGIRERGVQGVDNFSVPKTLAQLPAVWADQMTPVCMSQGQAEGWSIGWRWHPACVFDTSKVEALLKSLSWQRAKLVIRSENGWVSGNAIEQDEMKWATTEWRKDSRLELIFVEPQDEIRLTARLRECLA